MTTPQEDAELFQDSFHEWLEAHGVVVHHELEEDGWLSHIEMNGLKLGIVQLIKARDEQREREIRLNELKHRANDAIERMWRVDRAAATQYVSTLPEFYTLTNPQEQDKEEE